MTSTNTSQKKLEANRRNAQRSTGPKTAKGKEAVKWNALKHGLLAKEVVIESGKLKEDRAEFEELLTLLRAELQPAGILENMLVEEIAICYWRRRRVIRSEVGEIRAGEYRATRLHRFALSREELKSIPELNAEEAGQALPPSGPAGKILRYDTTITRQMYKAINELERLQRRRLGDTVPPPINVQLSREP